MGATGLILDGLLILLLLAALAYGLRLERRLTGLRQGQEAFAQAVGELNQAAGRAEAALASLRAASEETDALHGRILAARSLKAELEGLIDRAERARPSPAAASTPAAPARPRDDEAETQVFAPSSPARLIQALAANRLSETAGNRRPGTLDDDLFETAPRRRA